MYVRNVPSNSSHKSSQSGVSKMNNIELKRLFKKGILSGYVLRMKFTLKWENLSLQIRIPATDLESIG